MPVRGLLHWPAPLAPEELVALVLKNILFTVLVPGTVAVLVPLSIARGRQRASGVALVPAVLLLGTGAAIYARCLWDFATFGRGTPLPLDAPKRLVIRGLYRLSRNAMYVGVLTAILGWAVYFQSLALFIYAGVVGASFHLFIVAYEEPHLRRTFGAEYVDYCARVGRWLSTVHRRRAG